MLVPALVRPDGTLVPDRRDPRFSVPDWVFLPAFLQPHLAARASSTVADSPYRIERALHFSNGGGVYAATDRRTGHPDQGTWHRPSRVQGAGSCLGGASKSSRASSRLNV